MNILPENFDAVLGCDILDHSDLNIDKEILTIFQSNDTPKTSLSEKIILCLPIYEEAQAANEAEALEAYFAYYNNLPNFNLNALSNDEYQEEGLPEELPEEQRKILRRLIDNAETEESSNYCNSPIYFPNFTI